MQAKEYKNVQTNNLCSKLQSESYVLTSFFVFLSLYNLEYKIHRKVFVLSSLHTYNIYWFIYLLEIVL